MIGREMSEIYLRWIEEWVLICFNSRVSESILYFIFFRKNRVCIGVIIILNFFKKFKFCDRKRFGR